MQLIGEKPLAIVCPRKCHLPTATSGPCSTRKAVKRRGFVADPVVRTPRIGPAREGIANIEDKLLSVKLATFLMAVGVGEGRRNGLLINKEYFHFNWPTCSARALTRTLSLSFSHPLLLLLSLPAAAQLLWATLPFACCVQVLTLTLSLAICARIAQH